MREIEAFVEKYDKMLDAGKPAWLPLAEEIRNKIKVLLDQLYQEVPPEIRKFHLAEARSQGTNWELVAGTFGKNRHAYRMHWGDEGLGMIKAILLDAEDEAREKLGPRPAPKLARLRTTEERAERDATSHNEWQKKIVGRGRA